MSSHNISVYLNDLKPKCLPDRLSGLLDFYRCYRTYTHFIDCIQAHNVEIHLGRMSLPFTIREWGFHLRLSTNSAAKYFTLTAFFFSCSADLYSLPTESKVFKYQTCAFAICIRIDVTNRSFKGTFILSWRLIIISFKLSI